MKPDKNAEKKRRTPKKETPTQEEIRTIIQSIKRKNEQEFQERLEKMTPEERKSAIEFANDLL